MRIEQLETKLKQVEKELQEAEWEEGFERALKEYRGKDEVISFQSYKQLLEGKQEPIWRVKSNIPTLDDLIGGFQEGNLIVVTAPTGQGKTTFCQTLTRNFADNGVRCLWFSYEVPPREFLEKFGENLPVAYLPKALVSRTMIWIERKIVEAIAKYQTKVVFIDHLHYLLDLSKVKNASLEIGAIMRELKLMALKYNIVIFIVAHMTKTRFEDKVGLEDIRDSSFISQEADYVIVLWRDATRQSKRDLREKGVIYTNEAVASVEKNRRTGRTGSLRLILKDNLFYEVTENYGEEPIKKI